MSGNGKDFSLFHRKVNNIKLQPAQNWSVDFSPEKVVYTRGDVYQTENAGTLSYAYLVERILQSEGPKTRDSLADTITAMKGEAYDKVKRNVSTAVSNHKKDGKVSETSEGVVSLVSKGEETWTI